MKLTNKYNLPQAFVNAVANDDYDDGGADISVTSLIDSARIYQLKKRHKDELVEDVSDGIYKLEGKAIHRVLEKACPERCEAERRISVDILGWTVSGQGDLYEVETDTGRDYKRTKVKKIMDRDYDSWEKQLNIYSHLWRTVGHRPKRLFVDAILRDFDIYKVGIPGYPECRVVVVPINLWPADKAMEYSISRVAYHQEAEKLPDDKLPLCTPGERWEQPTTFKVKKKGNKRSTKNFTNFAEAERFRLTTEEKSGNKYIIETEEGGSVRCGKWCGVNKFCSQYDGEKRADAITVFGIKNVVR